MPSGSKVAFRTSARLDGDMGERTAAEEVEAAPPGAGVVAWYFDRRSITSEISPIASGPDGL